MNPNHLAPCLPAVLLVLLAGCASTIPEPILHAPEQAPTFAQAQSEPEEAHGAPVRWGGTVLKVENLDDHSRIEILARPLNTSGRPRSADESPGRFFARVDTFIDPAVVGVGREITVAGSLDGVLVRTISAFEYHYPVVATDVHHLWPEQSERIDPRWSDPWYDPYDPFHRPWPYRPWHPDYGPYY